MSSEWVAWHEGYAPGQPLTLRLQVVQRELRAALDAAPLGTLRLISMCAGDGRDVLGMLPQHPRRDDVGGLLVELDPSLAATAATRAAELRFTSLEVRRADAGNTDAFAGAVPAHIVMVCGVFGNITDADVKNTVDHLAELSTPGATVIWTRGTFEPDLTPAIREWFRDAGFDELNFTRIPDTTAAVGAHRLRATPRDYKPGVQLFTFLEKELRPSNRGG